MRGTKQLIGVLIENLKQGGPGKIGALIGFVLALLLVLFGILKTIFILLLTVLGYYLGVRYFADKEAFKMLLDKLFPPGMFR